MIKPIKTDKISNKIVLLIFLMPVIIGILFLISAFDYMVYKYIDESSLNDILFPGAMYLTGLLSLFIVGWDYFTKYIKGEFSDNTFSDTIRNILDFLIKGFICGFILFLPVRGTILLTNRMVGQQKEIKIHGTVQGFQLTKSRYERANKLFLLDRQFNRTIRLRIMDDAVYRTGEWI